MVENTVKSSSVMALNAEHSAAAEKPQQENDMRHQTMESIGRRAGDEAHDLGNTLVAIAFCLKQLRGRQRTEELDAMVERGLQVAEQGIQATRSLLHAARALQRMANDAGGRQTDAADERL